MPYARDHLEAIIWPNYRGDVASLCQALWGVANPKQSEVRSPEWFNEIVESQIKSMLLTIFSSPQTWVIFPEPLPGFSVVVYKKPRGAASPAPQQQLKLRHHTLDQFSELARLVEKAAIKLLKRVTSDPENDVAKLENEELTLFLFPRPKMTAYLTALGFSEEQIPKLLTIEDIEDGFGEAS